MSEKEPDIIVTVELSNGHFKSSLRQPLDAPPAEKQRFVDQWLQLMAMGLRMNIEEMHVGLGKEKP